MNGTSNKSPISGKRGRKVYVIYENVNAGGGGGGRFCIGMAEDKDGDENKKRLVARWSRDDFPKGAWFDLPDIVGSDKHTDFTDINALIAALEDFKEGKI